MGYSFTDLFVDFFGFTLPWFLRQIVSFIDGWIYTADAELYDLITKIARQEIFSEGTLNEVAGRVYQLLALIMIFRLVFLFITYVINPDDMLDKTKGYQNIIKKMIITLGLIIITPWAFDQARVVQQLVLEEGIIEYFVFGQSSSASISSGYEFMHTVGKLFVIPYQCVDNQCKTSLEQNYIACAAHSKWDENIAVNNDVGEISCKDEVGGTCANYCGSGAGEDANYAATLFKAAYPDGAKYDLRSLMSLGGWGNPKTAKFYSEYKFPFIGTTLVGAVIGYMLIIMCIDIAVRSVKLSFYELIAPVPIVSYIGPKSGKDTMLGKWFTQVLKTYADLFTRIAGLEIAVFFIDTLLENETLVKSNDFFVELFLIIGALTFAKKLPDILKDLGVNFSTGGFNLKKKLNDEMLGSKVMKRAGAAGLAFAGGATANSMRAISNHYKRKKDIEEEARKSGMSVGDYKKTKDFQDWKRGHRQDYGSNPIAGAFSAAARAATTKDAKVFASAAAGVKGAVEKRDLRDQRKNADYRIWTRAADSVRGWAGVDTQAKAKIKEREAALDDIERRYSADQYNYNRNYEHLTQTLPDYTQNEIRGFLKENMSDLQSRVASGQLRFTQDQLDTIRTLKELEASMKAGKKARKDEEKVISTLSSEKSKKEKK